jgi:putative endonuclease
MGFRESGVFSSRLEQTVNWRITRMAYFTYILMSESTGAYYVGHTTEEVKRLAQHNTGQVKSTKSGIPWVIVHLEEFSTRGQAFSRERQIKGRKSRRYIESLISSTERSAAR